MKEVAGASGAEGAKEEEKEVEKEDEKPSGCSRFRYSLFYVFGAYSNDRFTIPSVLRQCKCPERLPGIIKGPAGNAQTTNISKINETNVTVAL